MNRICICKNCGVLFDLDERYKGSNWIKDNKGNSIMCCPCCKEEIIDGSVKLNHPSLETLTPNP